MMTKNLMKPVIFPGHGGTILNEYVTAPNKMYTFEDGLEVHEGVINRKICDYFKKFLDKKGFPSIYFQTDLDTPLSTKTEIGERCNSVFNNCFLVDVHNNAGGGTGTEVFTSPKQTESDKIATIMYDEISKEIGKGWRMRKDCLDRDPDKEAEFYMLMNTYLPSVLVECAFMDTREDAELITSEKGQKQFARALANAVLTYNGWKKVNKNEKV